MKISDLKFKNVDDYISGFPQDVQAILHKIRLTIKRAAPQANERISYGMPFYEYQGKGNNGRLIYFAAFKKHISLFITPRDTETISKRMKQFHVSKATYQFPLGKPFPFGILKETVKALVNARELKNNSTKNLQKVKTTISREISSYTRNLSPSDKTICKLLSLIINKHLTKSENKIWHGHPVWFLNGNPIVGYSKQKDGVRLLFWSGASFDEEGLTRRGKKFKDASIFYHSVSEINTKDLKRWLKKSEVIQWDYKNIVKRRGKLERLK
ncbi:MAG: uncharacterized protein OJF59_000282 [Cytophagales bacterium]|jgi:uncharacterized protein YdhG (YjbR/CyaY superfamily)|nr:MAG: uncharacterized protein OJF59_000282 [Cytophagales bacterium]